MCDSQKAIKYFQSFSGSYNTYQEKEVYPNHYGASDLRAYLVGDVPESLAMTNQRICPKKGFDIDVL